MLLSRLAPKGAVDWAVCLLVYGARHVDSQFLALWRGGRGEAFLPKIANNHSSMKTSCAAPQQFESVAWR